jgi:amino acid permease
MLLVVVYTSIVYGYLYLLFTTLTEVYESIYGFSTGLAGLAFIGIGVMIYCPGCQSLIPSMNYERVNEVGGMRQKPYFIDCS